MKKIIVMDDEPTIVEVLSQGLRAVGYVVEGVSTKADLMAAIAREKPVAILMDVGMPGEDGISICRDLRRDEETRNIPVIVVTAFNDEITRSDAFLFGANAFITKPFSIPEIQKILEKCLCRSV
jgi:two-component system alkaline phosphatase synthesis response regulator PhoP